MKKNTEEVEKILSLLNEGKTHEQIGAIVGKTASRIQQIAAKNGYKGLRSKKTLSKLEEILINVKQDVEAGLESKELVSKYTRTILDQLRNKLNFSVPEYRKELIIQRYKNNEEPLQIAKHFNYTRTAVYSILHENGIKIKLSPEEQEERNAIIRERAKQGEKQLVLANEFGITQAMVSYIVKEEV